MGLLSGLGRMAPMSMQAERRRAERDLFAQRDPGISAYDFGDTRMEAGTDLGAAPLGEDDPSYWAEQGKAAPGLDPALGQAGLSMMDEATPDQPDYMQVRRAPKWQRQTDYSYKPYGQY